MLKPTTIYVVRHGESEGTIKGLYGETPEVSLTKKGEQQITALAKKLSAFHIDAIISSDLVRAQQTATILTKERALAVNMKKMLRERSYGRLDGKTAQEMRDELKEIYTGYEHMSNKEKYYFKLVADMETTDEAVARVIIALREIGVAYSGKTIIVVSHAGLMRGLLIHLGYVDFHEIESNYIQNAAYIKLETDGVDFFIKETVGISKVK